MSQAGTPMAGNGESHGLPSALPRPAGELAALERAWESPRGWRLLSAVNNTDIGLFYIGTALLFFVLAGVLALLMRMQLAWPNGTLLGAGLYNQVFTMHGTVMMFLFAVPMVEAIAVYLLPGMLGARDLPFPRLSAYAFWAYAFGGLAFFCTIFFGVSPDGGWFMYPPLTGRAQSPGPGPDWWLLGIGFIEISAIAGAIELIVGVLFTRAPGMTLARMPVFAWSMLVVALMVVFAFPAVIAGTTLLEVERAFDWPFFIAERGGDPLLWQHLFWFFGHPEVYIISLPAAGLVSMMIPTLARTPLAGHRAVVAGLIGVAVMSFAVWAHHMFTAGLGSGATTIVSIASLAIAIPTALQVFAWLATLARGRLQWNSATLFVLGFLFVFVLGGLTGVMVAVTAFDTQVHDTYFVVAHLHYVLIGGLVFPMFAALYHWTPLVNGHRFSERVGHWVFGLMFAGFNLAFFPMHMAGLMGMPRRVYTYPAGLGWDLWNLLSSLGAAVFAVGVALFFVDAIRTWRRPKRPHDNPWQGRTLEWLPAEDYGLRSIPEVDSIEPLRSRPTLGDEVIAGAHWLPGTALGGRETLFTSAVAARPQHLIVLPGDSWRPFVAGIGTAGFFLLLTVQWMAAAFACGAIAIGAVFAWLWETDRAPASAMVDVASGVRLPVGARGRRAHSWWATLILVVVDLTIFASLAFAHLHLAMRSDVCPPSGATLPSDTGALWAVLLLCLASAAVVVAQRSLPAAGSGTRLSGLSGWLPIAGLVAALVSASASAGLAWVMQRDVGLAPVRDAWSASVAMLLAWQLFHAAVLSLMTVYAVARIASGRVGGDCRATLDNIALFWHGALIQAALGIGLVQLLPRLLG